MFGIYIIEAGKEPRPLLTVSYGIDDGNKPVVFETGKAAADWCKFYMEHGETWLPDCAGVVAWLPSSDRPKVQPRRLADDAWKARELGRFADGTYIPLPWVNLLPKLDATADHFPHVSTVDGAKIAYTQDAAKGAGDIQTRVKPGRYLQQFYSGTLDAPTIARLAAEFDLQFGENLTLQFAETADDIERVYVNGPRSCMAYGARHFRSSRHPVRVYAAGDLAVAYLEREGAITARALCWPAKKLFGRVYGDETRLRDLLETADFSAGDLDGARMLRIEEGNGFVVPYIDGCCSAGDAGTHLVLGGRGIDGGQQYGLSAPQFTCADCDGEIDEDDRYTDDNGTCRCESCHDELYGYCEHYDETCERDGMEEVITRARHSRRRAQTWGARAIENDAFRCEGTGDLYSNDLLVELADGTQWSTDYFEDYGAVCEGSGENYAAADCVTLEDGTVWSRDHFDANGVTVDGKLYDADDAPETDNDDDATTAPEALEVA